MKKQQDSQMKINEGIRMCMDNLVACRIYLTTPSYELSDEIAQIKRRHAQEKMIIEQEQIKVLLEIYHMHRD